MPAGGRVDGVWKEPMAIDGFGSRMRVYRRWSRPLRPIDDVRDELDQHRAFHLASLSGVGSHTCRHQLVGLRGAAPRAAKVKRWDRSGASARALTLLRRGHRHELVNLGGAAAGA